MVAWTRSMPALLAGVSMFALVLPAAAQEAADPAAEPPPVPDIRDTVDDDAPPEPGLGRRLFGLPSLPPPIDEIVVTGQYIPDEKRVTSEISELLDTDALSAFGDSNIAVSLQRVPGLSLSQGSFVIVRGLNERYSQALLNGAQLPSPEPLTRVVPLDIFPNSVLAGVLVQKTYSPQYGADFGGGVLALRTLAIPEERFFEAGVSLSFNTASVFEDGLTFEGEGADWLGVDFGDRDLPDGIPRELDSLSAAELEAAGESLPDVYTPELDDNPPGVSLELAYGDRFTPGRWRLGDRVGGRLWQ